MDPDLSSTGAGARPAQGRRRTLVLRNLDTQLKLGPLSPASASVVMLVLGVGFFTESTLGWLSALVGGAALLWVIGAAAGVGVVLYLVEQYEDVHFVPSSIGYALARRWRHVYTAAGPERYEETPLAAAIARARDRRMWRTRPTT